MIAQSTIEVRGKWHSVVVVDGVRFVECMGYTNKHTAKIEAKHVAERKVLEAVENATPEIQRAAEHHLVMAEVEDSAKKSDTK